MLRAITGSSVRPEWGSTLTGADRLALTPAISVDQLGTLCDQLIEAYGSTAYRKRFAWIDNLAVVRDPDLRASLDDELVTRLRDPDLSKVQLAAPDPVDWELATGYRYSVESRNGELHQELDLKDYLRAVTNRRGEPPTIDRVRSDRVQVVGAAAERPLQQWSVYRTMVFDLEKAGMTYALTDGNWYEIKQFFAESITAQVAEIDESDLIFPDAHLAEREDAYVLRAAPEMTVSNGIAVEAMDKKLAFAQGAATGVEVCDLLSELGHFVHVKKGNESATLSHLFAQGAVSAELFLSDPQFRASARVHVNGTPCDTDDLFPLTVQRDHVTVIYAVVNPRAGSLAETLPFFSRVNLANAAKRLRSLGCRVQQKHISQV
jgi:uncharacterized protein (TIGR04141 family)